jgi:hypothetical protein
VTEIFVCSTDEEVGFGEGGGEGGFEPVIMEEKFSVVDAEKGRLAFGGEKEESFEAKSDGTEESSDVWLDRWRFVLGRCWKRKAGL